MDRNEAIEIVRKNWPDGRHQLSEALETLIPELKESEDERIRKSLVAYFVKFKPDDMWNADFSFDNIVHWLEKQGKETSWKPSKEEMDVLYGLAYITNQYDEHKEEVITRLYQDLKREFFNGSSYENMFPSSPVDAPIKLEKQGEQNPADIERLLKAEYKKGWDKALLQLPKEVDSQIWQIANNSAKTWGQSFAILRATQKAYDKDRKDALREQNHADNVEPKFKVGDIIADIYCTGKVIELTDDSYLLDTGQGIPFSCEHNTHLWTIQDAKVGDVLYSKKGRGIEAIDLVSGWKKVDGENSLCSACTYRIEDDEILTDGLGAIWWDGVQDPFRPATQEQRNLLFQKIKEAGYEWDAEKKELRKIEQKSVLNNALKEAFDKSKKDYPIEDKKEAIEYSDSILPTSVVSGESEEEYMLHTIMEAAFIAGQNKLQNNQNPAWTEEDKERYISCLQRLSTGNPTQPETINSKWFKERISPLIFGSLNGEQNSAWSEEDENRFRNLIFLVEHSNEGKGTKEGFVKFINRLKSLKDRYTWKPSDEQMHYLSWIANIKLGDGVVEQEVSKHLNELHNDLKKLKG